MSTTMPRDAFATELQAAFPDWLVIPVESVPDAIDRPTLVIKQRSIVPLDAAPFGLYQINCMVTLIDPGTDLTLAEPALDANITAVWEQMLEWQSVVPNTATKVMFSSQYMAYDIDTNLVVQKG